MLIELYVAGATARTAVALVGGKSKEKWGRGAAGKVPVFGLLNGMVFTLSTLDAISLPLINK